MTRLTAPIFGQPLSRRERQVANLIADAHTNESIALQLDISSETVRRHLYSIYEKLGINTRLELSAIVWKRRIKRTLKQQG